jgi:hypothetical protein
MRNGHNHSARLALSVQQFAALAQEQESELRGGKAGSGRGLRALILFTGFSVLVIVSRARPGRLGDLVHGTDAPLSTRSPPLFGRLTKVSC